MVEASHWMRAEATAAQPGQLGREGRQHRGMVWAAAWTLGVTLGTQWHLPVQALCCLGLCLGPGNPWPLLTTWPPEARGWPLPVLVTLRAQARAQHPLTPTSPPCTRRGFQPAAHDTALSGPCCPTVCPGPGCLGQGEEPCWAVEMRDWPSFLPGLRGPEALPVWPPGCSSALMTAVSPVTGPGTDSFSSLSSLWSVAGCSPGVVVLTYASPRSARHLQPPVQGSSQPGGRLRPGPGSQVHLETARAVVAASSKDSALPPSSRLVGRGSRGQEPLCLWVGDMATCFGISYSFFAFSVY